MSSSSEKEIEVSVQLIDLNDNKQGASLVGPPQVLDEQILLLNDEAVFEFSPIGTKTNSTNILIEVSHKIKLEKVSPLKHAWPCMYRRFSISSP